ncbi:MAG: DUF3857 domain-containing protein [Saprospiraceae bacterium]|nr:DUF3857 domain-containing protein [Saprospiraceae bacterium]
MNKLRFSILLFFGLSELSAQVKYPFSEIPDSLTKGADLVIREHDLRFEVLDKGKAIETEHLVMTLLNDRVAQAANPRFYYYEFEEIEDIEASVYDADGKLVRNLRRKDIEDGKPLTQFINDVRYKELNLPSRAYPYTIEYTVVKTYKGLMFYPDFQPQYSPKVGVQHANFQITMPNGLEARYKELHVPADSQKGPMQWEFNNLAPFKAEPNTPESELNLARIMLAPNEFSFFGIDGDMRSWQSFGAFIEKLNATQRNISPELKAKLEAMVADCPDMECKIKRVYEYMQSNTRYFYVGLGVGGWQPAPATKVDQYKYGDCKGLSNYMVSMLNSIEVPAKYVLIRAGEAEQKNMLPDFPNPYFTHAIACVPMEKDTVWLECTSQTESCGFLGTFTDHRPALIITPDGGQLVMTPKYDERVNTIVRETQISLESNGSATLVSKDVYSGISQNLLAELEGVPDELRRKVLYKQLNISDFEIKSLSLLRKRDRIPSVEQNLELSLPRFATSSGKRLFVPLSPLTNKLEIPSQQQGRKSSVQAHSRGTTETDELVIALPFGFELESSVEPQQLQTPFGSYELSAKMEDNKLIVHRKLVLTSAILPKEKYPDFIAFLKAVGKADKAKIVLKQTERP